MHPKASAAKRRSFRQKIEVLEGQNRPIVYIDESGFAHDMPRTHGYSEKGKRCSGVLDWNARGRVNVIGALFAGTLLSVGLTDANVDAEIFHMWATRDLLPKLPNKSVLVLDNATFHKRKDTRATIEAAGHTVLFLPPYSPDLNDIEHTWAQAKSYRRKTGLSVDEIFSNQNWKQN